jgi:trimeric autotransporter adhesin
VVAQNDQDLAAERGLSTFDQRHRFTGDFTFDWRGWQVNGSIQLASGTPFTARVLGDIRDVASGTNGTLRANYNGAPIEVSDPTLAQFFNTAAFSLPSSGTFGNAGRNIIIGPGTTVMNLGVTRTITLGGTRGLSIQVLANNLLNTVQFASIDTVVNSPTFGQVAAVRPMRRIQLLTRFRF